MSDVTRILSQINDGDPKAAEQLLPLVYDELRKLAAAKMAQEKPGQTLQATALVHEAYIRLVDVEKAQHWDSRGISSPLRPRRCGGSSSNGPARRNDLKRGGDRQKLDIDGIGIAGGASPEQVLAIDDAVVQLAALDNSLAGAIVRLRYFAGLSVEQAGAVLGISSKTAYRHWNYSRAWLYAELLTAAD